MSESAGTNKRRSRRDPLNEAPATDWFQLALICAAALVTAVLCAWLAMSQMSLSSRDGAQHELELQRDFYADKLAYTLRAQKQAAQILVNHPVIEQAALADRLAAGSIESVRQVFELIARPTGLAGLVITDARSGRIRLSLRDSAQPGQDLSSAGDGSDFAVLYRQARQAGQDGQVSFSVLGTAAQPESAYVSAPIIIGRRFVAMVQLRIDLASLANGLLTRSNKSSRASTLSVLTASDSSPLSAQIRQSMAAGQRTLVQFSSDSNPVDVAFRNLRFLDSSLVVAVSAPTSLSGFKPWPLLSRLLAASLLACVVFGAIALRRQRASGRSGVSSRILNTVRAIKRGDFDQRAEMRARTDPTGIGEALDLLLDERQQLKKREHTGNDGLNHSVVQIMQAVGTIASSRDLRVKVPVGDDVTGAVSEAINVLTEETAQSFSRINATAQEVARATLAVKGQTARATKAAQRERLEVEQAARELAMASNALIAIGEHAGAIDGTAGRTIAANSEAVECVERTAVGVGQTRVLIRQTEKRVKGLGERAQEIGQVVGLIDTIAQRTGILALNASLQAASAGESGKNLAVLADEVKRLSESATEATAAIGRLITTMQAETAETLKAMGLAISEVVSVSELSKKAGMSMVQTHDETRTLAEGVRAVASTSAAQASVSTKLQKRARIIRAASDETARQLALQSAETTRLVESARTLLEEVGAFKTDD